MSKPTYIRVCFDCGDTKEITYKPKKTTLCHRCALKGRNLVKGRWDKTEIRISYIYFCPHCPNVRDLTNKRGGAMCGDCSRKYSKKEKIITWFDFDTMSFKTNKSTKPKFVRVCGKCGDVKEVKTLAASKAKTCKGCNEKRISTLQPRRDISKKKKAVSKEAIGKAREINRKHKKTVVETVETVQTKCDNELIREFLKKNKPSVVDNDCVMGHVSYKNGLEGW